MYLFFHPSRIVAVVWGLTGAFAFAVAEPPPMPTSASILTIAEHVADWQLANKSRHAPDGWIHATATIGIMELAGSSSSPRFHDAMLADGRAKAWKLGSRVYHADDHAIGQLYLALYAHDRDPAMIAPLRERFDFILAHPKDDNLDYDSAKNPDRSDRWSWCDALFMAPATWVELAQATGNNAYLEFAVEKWWKTSAYLFDRESHLFYRDSRYFTQREANGAKIFWGRGNGWVMGALVRVMQALPANHPARPRFEQQFREMSGAILRAQQPDGLWRASLLDPASYPAKETSGSGFYCYAFAWGVNHGLLDRTTYLPATLKAWRALTECITPEGKLTHVQPVGGSPKIFDPESTDEYGVGAFLLAACEIYRLAERPN